MKLHFPIFVTPKTLDTYGYVYERENIACHSQETTVSKISFYTHRLK